MSHVFASRGSNLVASESTTYRLLRHSVTCNHKLIRGSRSPPGDNPGPVASPRCGLCSIRFQGNTVQRIIAGTWQNQGNLQQKISNCFAAVLARCGKSAVTAPGLHTSHPRPAPGFNLTRQPRTSRTLFPTPTIRAVSPRTKPCSLPVPACSSGNCSVSGAGNSPAQLNSTCTV